MPRAVIVDTIEVVQRQYKDAETVLCEFMAIQEYDIEEGKIPTYKDFNLQEFHDFVTDKIEALDPIISKKRGPYKTKQE